MYVYYRKMKNIAIMKTIQGVLVLIECKFTPFAYYSRPTCINAFDRAPHTHTQSSKSTIKNISFAHEFSQFCIALLLCICLVALLCLLNATLPWIRNIIPGENGLFETRFSIYFSIMYLEIDKLREILCLKQKSMDHGFFVWK